MLLSLTTVPVPKRPQATSPTAPLTAGTRDTLTYPAYDADGHPLSRVDGNNVTTTYAYTAPDSRLTDITYPAGTLGAVHLTYDSYGRRAGVLTAPAARRMPATTTAI